MVLRLCAAISLGQSPMSFDDPTNLRSGLLQLLQLLLRLGELVLGHPLL